MRRRLIAFLLIISLLSSVLPLCTSAQAPTNEYRIDYEDGSYSIITIESSSSLSRTTQNHQKSEKHYNANDVLEWKIILVATFTYDGTTSTCIAAGCDATVYTSQWSVVSESATENGNTAIGYATLGRHTAGIKIGETNRTLTLTCDPNGNVS